jgi:hypothetical protein
MLTTTFILFNSEIYSMETFWGKAQRQLDQAWSVETSVVSRPSESRSATISSPPGERVSQEIMSPEQVEARYERNGQLEALLFRS